MLPQGIRSAATPRVTSGAQVQQQAEHVEADGDPADAARPGRVGGSARDGVATVVTADRAHRRRPAAAGRAAARPIRLRLPNAYSPA